jgi:predicted outer membrane protein
MSAMGSTGAGGSNAFDRAYIAQQVTAHARTLAIVDAAIARGTQAELKTALQSQVRPSVAQHLQMAQQIQQRLGSQ